MRTGLAPVDYMKQLLLCRHAKSSWKNPALADFDRPLNKRGKRNAPVMGARLAARGMVPELILSSSAKRARKTAMHLCRGMQVSKDLISLHKSLYDTDSSGLLDVISRTDDGCRRLLLVGHNYELTELANGLAPMDIYNVPTCGIVACTIVVDSWRDIRCQLQVELLFFDYPKKQGVDLL